MTFILRIFFSGLIAFVPSQNGKELTVLLLKADHGYHVSDGTMLPEHKPLLLARAGNCVGDCPTSDPDIAQFLFSDIPTEAVDALGNAVSGGGAWQLSGSDLSVRRGCSRDPAPAPLVLQNNVRAAVDGHPEPVPTTAEEREDLSWVPDLREVCAGCALNPAVLSAEPPQGVIAARLHLRNGKAFTYSLARIGNDVTPVHFQRLDGQGDVSPYSQAVANWVAADIQILGDTVEIVEDKFDGSTGRSMSLGPRSNGLVEMAVLNVPAIVPPVTPTTPAPTAGRHFELYYDLLQTPPPMATRLVPEPGPAPTVTVPTINWDLLHPRQPLWSDLLAKLRLEIGRGPYDRTLCPMVHF